MNQHYIIFKSDHKQLGLIKGYQLIETITDKIL